MLKAVLSEYEKDFFLLPFYVKIFPVTKFEEIRFVCVQISDAIENEKVVHKTIKIYNVDRAVCGRIAGVVAKKYGDTGFAGQLNIT